MPSMRQSYTVTVPEEPPAAAFPFLKQEMRRKGSMSGSVLVSTFVGLLINQTKVRPGQMLVAATPSTSTSPPFLPPSLPPTPAVRCDPLPARP